MVAAELHAKAAESPWITSAPTQQLRSSIHAQDEMILNVSAAKSRNDKGPRPDPNGTL